jgi:hypothetical protein
MGFTGHRVYRGVGGIGTVDFDTVVGTVQAGNDAVSLVGLGHSADTVYTYVLRPVLNGLEAPDYSCAVEFATDSQGDWLGNRPAAANALSLTAGGGGKVRLQWQYAMPANRAVPADFAVYHSQSPGVDVSGQPAAIVSYDGDVIYSAELGLTGGYSYWFAVVARTGEGVPSVPAFAGPVVARAASPTGPRVYADAGF